VAGVNSSVLPHLAPIGVGQHEGEITMKKKYNQVYQFKIALEDSKPPIWRRIQVPETYTFWDLHVAIQDAMGWIDYHLHEFELVNPSTGLTVNIGSPNEDFGEEVLPDGGQKNSGLFLDGKSNGGLRI
jgi:hypothetical protein